MTHGELLAHMNKEIDQAAWTKEYYPFKALQALRAVVEWHSPSKSLMTSEVGCTGCGYNSEYSTWYFEWPCPTIHAIEREID